MMGIKQSSFGQGPAKTVTPIANPPTLLPLVQVAGEIDVTFYGRCYTLGNHVARVDSGLTTMKSIITQLSEQVAIFSSRHAATPSAIYLDCL